MAITPADIQAQTFSEAKRGYDPAEVDVFLEQLASEVDAMLNKIVDLKTRLTATEQELAAAQAQAQVAVAAPAPAPAPVASPEYTATASQISAALIAAQQSADNIVAEAQLVGVAQCSGGEVAVGLDLQHCEVGVGVGA